MMADLTKGYPFAFQVLGYLTWNHHGDYNAVRGEYEQYLSEFVYDKNLVGTVTERSYGCTWNCRCGRWKIKDIREHLHMETNEFNPYRKRLIKREFFLVKREVMYILHCRFLKNMLWKIINYLLTGQRI